MINNYHSNRQTFLKPTILAANPTLFVHVAVLIKTTDVISFFQNTSFEESFASFTCSSAIMMVSSMVTTDTT